MVKELLQNHSSKIEPNIERIMWLYKRWQPLYTDIKRRVSPGVEFIQGIPNDLDDDDYFDPRMNNLLILDDLFSESGKDKRITELFTEGSHHRSLSVISINQNLFGTKDPTQRRNCHYMVLFNNPIDKQSVMTLARQMYPGQCDILLKQFVKATKYPYGHLLVDLKPFTPEHQRLKCIRQNSPNSEATSHVTPQETIKEEVVPKVNHSSSDVQSDQIVDLAEPTMTEKMNSCDDCGLLFDTPHDVQRHVKRGWCMENKEESPNKKQKMEEDDSDDENNKENNGYLQLWKRAKDSNIERYNKIYQKLKDDGEESDTAQEMADERVQSYNEREFFGKYQTLIDNYMLPLRNNRLHQEIMAKIDKLVSKGYDTTSAVKKVLRSFRSSFQDLFDTELSDDEEDESDDEDEEEAVEQED